MASVEVTAVVASIVSAFSSGMDIFRRMRARQRFRRSKKKSEQLTEEEWQLHNSLQNRPRQIKAEYDRSVARLGDRFAIGDTTAQTSLNHSLLVLNVGLIQILSHALSDDTKTQSIARQSLLNLSETAAADVVRALGQLHTRLSSTPQLTTPIPPMKKTKRRNQETKTVVTSNRIRPVFKARSKSFSTTERKRPGPDPLVRGAWVRSKSGNAVIATSTTSASGTSTPKASNYNSTSSTSSTAQDQPAPRRSHHHTKSSPASSSSRPRRVSTLDHPLEKTSSYSDQSPPSYTTSPEQQHTQLPVRAPSLLLASPDVFTDTTPPSTYTQPLVPPPPPPKIPLGATQTLPTTTSPSTLQIRPRPPSVATFLTASTKLGEIPEHRWPTNQTNNASSDRPLLPWEQEGGQLASGSEDEAPQSQSSSTRRKMKGLGLLGLKIWKAGLFT